MSEVLKLSLQSLSNVVNKSTGTLHPMDESRAKELFKALRAAGEPLSASEVTNLAIEFNWPTKYALDLGELAQRIGDGGRVVIKHPTGWGEATVQKHQTTVN